MTTGVTSKLFSGGRLLCGAGGVQSGDVLVRGQRIVAIGAKARREAKRGGVVRIDLDGAFLAPGFVDLHTHGAVGVDFVTAERDAFARSMEHYLKHGVTSLLVSLYPSSWKASLDVLRRVAQFLADGVGRGVAVGIHLEGPFLNPGRPGALPKRNFRACSTRDAAKLLEAGGGWVRTVTVAPELPRGRELVRYFLKKGVVPAFGHSLAGYEETCGGIDAGIRYATHLFNAMSGIHHRDPGAVTALLENDEVDVEVISDGEHISVPVLQLIHARKPPERVILVSDSVHPCGLRDGEYEFAGAPVRLHKGTIQLPDGTLSGSALTMDRALRVQVQSVGASVDHAALACSANPARAIGLRGRGRIAVRSRADLVALDEKLRVVGTWLGGDQVFSKSGFGESL